MTDNDSLSNKMPARWSKAHAQFRQWILDPRNNIALGLLLALKNQVKVLGNPPLYHLRHQANHFRNIMPKFLAGSVNRVDEFEHIILSVRTLGGNKRGMNLSRTVSEKYLEALCDSPNVLALIDHMYPMSRSYVEKVYDSYYEANASRHTEELPRDVVNHRLAEIRPIIDLGIDHFAKQLAQHLDVTKLSIPRGVAAPKLKSAGEIDSYLQESIRIT